MVQRLSPGGPEAARVSVSYRVSAETDLPVAEGINFFHFTTVGPEVQMLVGTINLLAIHEAKQSGETLGTTPQITHRFLLSALGFNQWNAM
jgi:hypothetical protein